MRQDQTNEPDDARDRDGAALVEQLIRETPATTLMITHNHDLAARMDEVWIVENGRLTVTSASATAV